MDAETQSEDEDIVIIDSYKKVVHKTESANVVMEENVKKDIFDEMDDIKDDERQRMRAKTNEMLHAYNQIFGEEVDQMQSIKNQINVFLNEQISEKEINFMIAFCENNGED